jgi:hypothetical protein
LHVAYHNLLETVNLGAPTFIFRIRRSHSFGNETHFRVRFSDRDSLLQLAEHEIIMSMAVLQFPKLKGQRQPDLRVALREMGSRRHDSNHCFRLGIQRDALANDVGVAAKTALPEFVTQKCNVVLPEDFLFRKEVAAQNRLHSEQAEDIGRQARAR